MKLSDIPQELENVFTEFRTCEMTTISRKGTPATWPIVTFREPGTGRFVITISIGIAQKAFNIRRNPKISLLYSDPTGSGLDDPPAVLIQGDAEAPDEIHTRFGEYIEQFKTLMKRQPAGSLFSGNPVTRYLFDWYYMRLYIFMTPRRILWWDHGDFIKTPHEVIIE